MEEKQIKKEPATATWKEVLKGNTHWILLVLCIINLILWFVLLMYTVTQFSSLYRDIDSISSATREKPSAATLTQTKQEVEEKLIVRLTEEIRNIRREMERERKSIEEENKELKKKLLSLETQYDNFKRFWKEMVEKVVSHENKSEVRVERPEVSTSSVFIMTKALTESDSTDSGSGESSFLIDGEVLKDTNTNVVNYSPVKSTNESVAYNTEEESNITQGNQHSYEPKIKKASFRGFHQIPLPTEESYPSYDDTNLPLPEEIIVLLACRQGPKGDRGDDGAHGLPGINGSTGSKGEPGVTGPVGAQGEKGDKGMRGDNGEDGEPGNPGKPGVSGEKGDKGISGEKGSVGMKGEPGVKGARGLKGDPGKPGMQGVRGEKGNQGPTGAKGDSGSPGLPGVDGRKGDKGVNGPPGLPGKDGREVLIPDLFPTDAISTIMNTTLELMEISGLRGPPGIDGTPGTNGIDGTPGVDGIPGVDGTPGNDALSIGLVDFVHQTLTGGTGFLVGKSVYTLHTSVIQSWGKAKEFCAEQKGRQLAIIPSFGKESQEFFNKLDAFSAIESIWVGGKRASGVQKWIGGSSIPNSLWHSGEPNNSGSGENCVELKWYQNVWRLNDFYCHKERSFLCQTAIIM